MYSQYILLYNKGRQLTCIETLYITHYLAKNRRTQMLLHHLNLL